MDKHQILLRNLKKNMKSLEKLLDEVNEWYNYDDLLYRFYHQSYKVYHLQGLTIRIVKELKKVYKNRKMNSDFEIIFQEGTKETFKTEYNRDWLKHTRPIVESFLHARYFLEMAVKHGKELKKAPNCMPSGWAGLLYFYNLR